MNQLAKIDGQPKLMLLEFMADKYALKIEEFSRTVRAVCGLPKASPEEFAAFLLVAKEYNLNPLTKEIHAFVGRNGLVPVVSIDGWVNLINSHGALDGIEFEETHDGKGNLVSTTCIISRKDRSKPIVVTEYVAECRRDTIPWKMVHRMQRHKALIQCARYAFGFSGIYDEDEVAKIAEMRDITPRDEPPAPPPAENALAGNASILDGEIITTDNKEDAESVAPDPVTDIEAFKAFCVQRFDSSTSAEHLNDMWEKHVEPVKDQLFPPDEEDLMGAFRKMERILS